MMIINSMSLWKKLILIRWLLCDGWIVMEGGGFNDMSLFVWWWCDVYCGKDWEKVGECDWW